MSDWNDLSPAAQRRMLAERMRISRGHDLMAQSHTVEALAQSRELLTVPVFRWQNLRADAAFEDACCAPQHDLSKDRGPS